MTEKNKSFLKWVGGKYSSLDHIKPLFPTGKRLIEPFVGSGTIFLNLNYPRYLLADANPDLISLHRHVQCGGGEFVKYCASFFTPKCNTLEYYYKARYTFRNDKADERLRAALFLYLNWHGQKGLCRYSIKSGFNVPFGHNKKIYFPHKELIAFKHKSQQADFIHDDFCTTFSKAEPGDVIYCDPPYAPLPSQQTNFNSFTNLKFGKEDHIVLANHAINAAKRGISVLISNQDTAFTRELYCQDEIKSFSIRRRIGAGRSTKSEEQELLAIFHAKISF